MFSFSFPKMFNNTSANLIQGKEAIRQNMLCLLSSEKRSFFGDPIYGCSLKKHIFEQSNNIIVDLVTDDIYTAIAMSLPQVSVKRKDIKITISKNRVFVHVPYTYVIDNTNDVLVADITQTLEEDKYI